MYPKGDSEHKKFFVCPFRLFETFKCDNLLFIFSKVDDGSGCLSCAHFISTTVSKSVAVPPVLQQLQEQASVARFPEHQLQLGDTVSVTGRLNTFRDKPQLIINNIRILYC